MCWSIVSQARLSFMLSYSLYMLLLRHITSSPSSSPPQYQLNGQMSRMEPCLMSSTPRLHPAPVAPRWPDVSPANSCYTSPPMHSSRYAASGDMYSPLGPRRNSEYEHSQHFPGFAYINGEATTGWAK